MTNDWFRHDYNAHDDIKQKRLLKTIGLAGLGLYWYLVELIYQHGGQMTDADIRLEAELVDGAGLLDSLQSLKLLSYENGIWTCRRIKDELGFREMQKQKKSQAGRKGMASRWGDNNVITPDNSVITDDNSVITPDNTPITPYNTPITPDNTTITNDNTLPYHTIPIKEKDKTKVLSKKKNFQKPTFNEVKAYCDERGNNIDPQKFIDFYESKDWMIGKNRMKDWKASIRTWEYKDKESSSPTKHKDYSDISKEGLTGDMDWD